MGSRSICGIKRSKVANLISPCYKTALQRIYLQSLEFRPSCLLFRIYFRYKGVWLITRCGSLMENGYNIKHFPRCLVFLTLTGILSRCAAFFCMVTFQKKQLYVPITSSFYTCKSGKTRKYQFLPYRGHREITKVLQERTHRLQKIIALLRCSQVVPSSEFKSFLPVILRVVHLSFALDITQIITCFVSILFYTPSKNVEAYRRSNEKPSRTSITFFA